MEMEVGGSSMKGIYIASITEKWLSLAKLEDKNRVLGYGTGSCSRRGTSCSDFKASLFLTCCNVLEVNDLISQLTRGEYSLYTSSI
jgi:hypothetical protein